MGWKSLHIIIYSNIYMYANHKMDEEPTKVILQRGITEYDDIGKIFTWKLGGYYKSLPEERAKLRKSTVNLREVYNVVINNDGKKLFDAAVNVSGLGPVYSITLLFFKSQMYYPIFDKYARVALSAIINNDDLNDVQHYHYQTNPTLFWDNYLEYQNQLLEVFGERFRNTRIVDQALWAYGHIFEIVET